MLLLENDKCIYLNRTLSTFITEELIYSIPIAITMNSIFLEIALIPEAPKYLTIKGALLSTKKVAKHTARIATTVVILSEKTWYS